MTAHLGEPYREITLVKRDEQRAYRADRTDETGTVIANVGYVTTLKGLARKDHSAHLRSNEPRRGLPSRKGGRRHELNRRLAWQVSRRVREQPTSNQRATDS